MYRVAEVARAESYEWRVPPDAKIVSGQGTNEITVDLGSPAGRIEVVALNSCGVRTAPALSLQPRWESAGTFRATLVGQAVDIALDARGRIYIADAEHDRIVRADNISGAGWVTFAGPQGEALDRLTAVAVDGVGRIWIIAGDRVARMDDMQGTNWTELRPPGDEHLRGPEDIAFDSQGRVYIADRDNNRIVKTCFEP